MRREGQMRTVIFGAVIGLVVLVVSLSFAPKILNVVNPIGNESVQDLGNLSDGGGDGNGGGNNGDACGSFSGLSYEGVVADVSSEAANPVDIFQDSSGKWWVISSEEGGDKTGFYRYSGAWSLEESNNVNMNTGYDDPVDAYWQEEVGDWHVLGVLQYVFVLDSLDSPSIQTHDLLHSVNTLWMGDDGSWYVGFWDEGIQKFSEGWSYQADISIEQDGALSLYQDSDGLWYLIPAVNNPETLYRYDPSGGWSQEASFDIGMVDKPISAVRGDDCYWYVLGNGDKKIHKFKPVS